MSKYRVLLTDYAWPDVDLERRQLAEIRAELIVAPQPNAAEIAALAADVDAIMTCWAQVPQAVLAAAGRCRIVSRLGIGLDNIDVDYCTRHGIVVTNVPDYCVNEVAEHALALILALARRIGLFHLDTKNGRYALQAVPAPRRLAGQTLGIVGLGTIGSQLAQRARALGMKVLGVRRRPAAGVDVAERVSLDELLSRSDFVSLHVPLNPATRHLIGAAQLRRMKPSAFLINTARGGLVDHRALAVALESGHLAGAALDVQEPEPPDLTQPPFNDPRVIVTPHAAFVSVESLVELRVRAAGQVATMLCGGVPENIVNPEVLAHLRTG